MKQLWTGDWVSKCARRMRRAFFNGRSVCTAQGWHLCQVNMCNNPSAGEGSVTPHPSGTHVTAQPWWYCVTPSTECGCNSTPWCWWWRCWYEHDMCHPIPLFCGLLASPKSTNPTMLVSKNKYPPLDVILLRGCFIVALVWRCKYCSRYWPSPYLPTNQPTHHPPVSWPIITAGHWTNRESATTPTAASTSSSSILILSASSKASASCNIKFQQTTFANF